MSETDVLVVGAGPTGLMLACELALRGVRCRVAEQRSEQPNITRAFAVHARTLEVLDARGLADELLARGHPVQEVQPAPGAVVDLRTLDSRFPLILMAPQSATEHVLEDRARALGVEFARGVRVIGLRQDTDRVLVDVSSGRTEEAAFVVGCDGAHSTVRRLLGVDFVGSQYETHIMLADVRLDRPPSETLFAAAGPEGVVLVIPFGDGWFRAIAWDRRRDRVPLDVPLPAEEMRDSVTRIAGTDFGMGEQRWSSRFLSERRQARRYRVGRAFLAGDAAHVHSPLGGQGMNTGIQDAMNLGWKLAAVVRDGAGAWLLDSYEAERHPVGAQVLALTDGFNRLVLGRSAVGRAARRMAIRTLLRVGPARRELVGRLTGIGLAYPRRRGEHPWTGRRMPDLACADGRVNELLRDGRFLLVDRTGAGTAARSVADASTAVRTVRCGGPAPQRFPAVLLVRPDGYVAWAAEDGEDVAAAAVSATARWCGRRVGAAGSDAGRGAPV
ncbi:FAD-dependent monooxygenase [Geodermatophilus sp. YIM 151500]|uniref:FAD-dependent monooxygenase n=1 Tax=Geodermatophilus sp. YIM 151500 TaxID=2984531 RepID=UPI0021E50152|nr:FAD-dependent monooxygenase [Geodermatophilus sp. YIM 151500]MCV2488380.1 FAD-dependent monooxygenase [Geodermatophilus sp. YIM 151500]